MGAPYDRENHGRGCHAQAGGTRRRVRSLCRDIPSVAVLGSTRLQHSATDLGRRSDV
jgi:hypothetical protein